MRSESTKQHNPCKQRTTRTSGDGMEQKDISTIEAKTETINCGQSDSNQSAKTDQKQLRPNVTVKSLCKHRSTAADQSPTLGGFPKGKLHFLIPKLVLPKKKVESNKANRKPKFVPFEPYKCAVKPIVPLKKPQRVKQNRNNLDINILVTQMSDMKTSELSGPLARASEKVETELEKEREKYAKEIEELKKERDTIQAQLKFQVQVNSELKNLLVAAVGEDMQTKVHVLTEDKLQLAKALLDSANNLSTHTEQIEFLAGQCEVWRSKFLASSVMVEELARWKADLTHKNALLTKSSKRMLQLTAQIREMQLDILKNLKFLANLKQLSLPAGDLINLNSECLNISQQLVLHSGIGMPENLVLGNLQTLTEAEKDAVEALECVSQPLVATDEAFKAIVGQAFSSKAKVSPSIIEDLPTPGNKS